MSDQLTPRLMARAVVIPAAIAAVVTSERQWRTLALGRIDK